MLDFGAGPGTAALAVADTWPAALRESVAVEVSLDMLSLADALRQVANDAAASAVSDAPDGAVAPHARTAVPPPRVVPHLSRLRGAQQQRRYDIVVAAYSLGELPTAVRAACAFAAASMSTFDAFNSRD
jgi:ribosomal protein RSM22 (predicted rRNA methylase)